MTSHMTSSYKLSTLYNTSFTEMVVLKIWLRQKLCLLKSQRTLENIIKHLWSNSRYFIKNSRTSLMLAGLS
ncbi:hypothetical protein AHAS_Ahas13G0154100 [Arachis hypogaea]